MEDGIRNQSRSGGGDKTCMIEVDVTPKCKMASERLQSEVLYHMSEEGSDTSRTRMSTPRTCNSAGHTEELRLNRGDVACMSDFDDEDFTDTDVASSADSVMKIDCNTWKTEDSSYITVCCDCLWWIDSVRNVTFVFYSWNMLVHTRWEGLRDGQKMKKTRTTGGWQYREVCNIPPGMFSAGEIQRLLIGCCTQVGGSAVRTSHIRSDPTMYQAVLAAPVTGSLVSISWLNLKETARNVFSPRKRTYGGADKSKGIVFLVWIQLITEDCSMNTATSELPWDATEEVVDVSVAGVEIQPWLLDAMGLEGRTEHAARSRVLRGRDPRSIRVLIPVGQGPDQNVHDATIVDMGKVPEPHVSMLQLAELIHIWPPAVINHMTWRQREMERLRSRVRKELRDNSRKPCTFCGASIKINMYRHVVRCHLQLAQLWRCTVPWCTIWKGTSQDLMTHIVLGHKVPEEAKRADVQKFSLRGLSHANSMQHLCRPNIRAFRMMSCCLVKWD